MSTWFMNNPFKKLHKNLSAKKVGSNFELWYKAIVGHFNIIWSSCIIIHCNGIDWDEYPPFKTKYQIPYLSTLLSPKILMELFYTKETKRTRKDF